MVCTTLYPINSSTTILSKPIINKVPTDVQFVKRSVFLKELNIHYLWRFEIRTQEGINVLIRLITGFQHRDRKDSQNLNNDTFCRPPLKSAQSTIGTEKNHD